MAEPEPRPETGGRWIREANGALVRDTSEDAASAPEPEPAPSNPQPKPKRS